MTLHRNPWRLSFRGWKRALLRTLKEVQGDQVPIVAAGMAFWSMLAIFPALIALISIYGLVADPATIEQQVQSFSQILPLSARSLIATQLREIVRGSHGSLGMGLVGSLVGALWSASSGTKMAIAAINVAYDADETRGFFKLRGLALLLTAGALLLVAIIVVLIAVLPALFETFGVGALGRALVTYGRWPVMALVVMLGLAILYRLAPCREGPAWRFVTPGAVLATLLWLALTGVFTWCVSSFGGTPRTYGALGGVIVLLLWFLLSAFVFLLGAELNSEIERETGEIAGDERDPELRTRLATDREIYRPSRS
ncbi:MAG: YihY/virulence factor BrkB family protein [Sandaracinaceae bacterium]